MKQLASGAGERRRAPSAADGQADAPPAERAGATKSVAFERFDAGWRSRWDAAGLAFRPEAGDGFPHSGRESKKLAGALRSPTFVIDKPYLAVRVAGQDAKARLILNGLQLIQNPIYGGLAQPVNHGDELRWMVVRPADVEGAAGVPRTARRRAGVRRGHRGVVRRRAAAERARREGAAAGARRREDDAEAKKLLDRIRELEAKIPEPRRAPTMRDGTGINERVFIRGNHKTPGVEAPRAFLEAFGKPPFAGTGSGRLELAKAVTDPANPLVARVIVNRLWKHHFGEGIVRSPDDFGKQGQPPTHPELLDWLATELVKQKWSLSAMHRLMLISAAYRQSSRATPGAGREGGHRRPAEQYDASLRIALRVKLFRRRQHGNLRSGGHEAFKAAAFGIGVLATGDPDSAEVRMAVGGVRRGSAEVGLAIIGARRTRQRQLDPLGLRGEAKAQDEDKTRNDVREFHDASLSLAALFELLFFGVLTLLREESINSIRASPAACRGLGLTLHRPSLFFDPRNRELPRRPRGVHPRVELATVEKFLVLQELRLDPVALTVVAQLAPIPIGPQLELEQQLTVLHRT